MNNSKVTFLKSQNSFVCTQLNSFKYFYLTQIILLNSIKYSSFACTQLVSSIAI